MGTEGQQRLVPPVAGLAGDMHKLLSQLHLGQKLEGLVHNVLILFRLDAARGIDHAAAVADPLARAGEQTQLQLGQLRQVAGADAPTGLGAASKGPSGKSPPSGWINRASTLVIPSRRQFSSISLSRC